MTRKLALKTLAIACVFCVLQQGNLWACSFEEAPVSWDEAASKTEMTADNISKGLNHKNEQIRNATKELVQKYANKN